MAMTSKFVCMFLVLSLALPSTFATEFVVAGDLGWTLGVDVVAWLGSIAAIKVGDTFHFYFKSPRTVAVVDEAGYLRCDASGAQINDVSGSFSYTFTKSGIVSFISAGAGDCAAGLKMQFLVL